MTKYEAGDLAPIRGQLERVDNEIQLNADEGREPSLGSDLRDILDYTVKMANLLAHQREELVELRKINFKSGNAICSKCDGDKLVADTEGEEPWSQWTDLPLKSAQAVLMGLVKPKKCPRCNGTGREP